MWCIVEAVIKTIEVSNDHHCGGRNGHHKNSIFAYDAQGTPYSLTCTNGTATPETYYYITNLQGDVTYLINGSGTTVARYSYDPYGQIQLAFGSMAEINPLRYRGYYYDSDTEFYYLQSRYYDSEICRFINADSYIASSREFIGYNMFAYCNNSPITYLDEHGTFLGTLIGAVVGAAIGALDAAINGEDVLAGAASGAVSGAITGLAADVIAVTGGSAAVVIGVSAGASALGSVAGNVVENVVSGGKFDVKWHIEMGVEALWSGAFGALFGYMSGPVSSQLEKGLGKVIADTFCKNFVKKAAETAAEEVLSSSITGVAELFVKGCVRMVQTLM